MPRVSFRLRKRSTAAKSISDRRDPRSVEEDAVARAPGDVRLAPSLLQEDMAMQRLRIVVDTREQIPWQFPTALVVGRRMLKAGDYSVEGLEDAIAIERKSIDDLVGTIFHHGDRFGRELGKLAAMKWAAVVIEGNAEDVACRRYRFSDVPPTAVFERIAHLHVGTRIPFLFCGARADAVRSAENLLREAAKIHGTAAA